MQEKVTYFLARYQRGEKIQKELAKNLPRNPLLTGEEHILVGMLRMTISISLKLSWRKERNGPQTSLPHNSLRLYSLCISVDSFLFFRSFEPQHILHII